MSLENKGIQEFGRIKEELNDKKIEISKSEGQLEQILSQVKNKEELVIEEYGVGYKQLSGPKQEKEEQKKDLERKIKFIGDKLEVIGIKIDDIEDGKEKLRAQKEKAESLKASKTVLENNLKEVTLEVGEIVVGEKFDPTKDEIDIDTYIYNKEKRRNELKEVAMQILSKLQEGDF